MKIGNIELGKLPVVVGTVSTKLKMPVEILEKIDVFEIRVDMLLEKCQLSDIPEVIKAIKYKHEKPLIVTIRSAIEGGRANVSDTVRSQIIDNVISLVDAIDIELSSPTLLSQVSILCQQHNKIMIASYHNFNETPSNDFMENLIEQGKKSGAHIIKIAVKPNSQDDIARLIMFTIKNKKEGLITISLGSLGLISRIINPIVGSLMTYGYIDDVSSPGQISVFDCIEYLRLFAPSYNESLIEKLSLLEFV